MGNFKSPRHVMIKPIAVLALAAVFLAGVSAFAADNAKPDKTPAVRTAPPLPLAPKNAEEESQTYERCMKLAKENAEAARSLAEGWRDHGGAHPADHCYAVALIGLHQYKQAATRLETLGQSMPHAPASLRAEVLAQAGQAWLLSGDPARAYAADTAALTLRPDDSDLLVDRSEAAGMAGWFDKAVADLDRVLRSHPQRVDALIYRASAKRELNQLDPAQADIDKALGLAPDSADALLERGNIRRLRGDPNGARADWVRVSVLAPGSSADRAAKSNIERLELKDEPAPSKQGGRGQ
jgi:tetratricopeptide (TPR) repeat protein